MSSTLAADFTLSFMYVNFVPVVKRVQPTVTRESTVARVFFLVDSDHTVSLYTVRKRARIVSSSARKTAGLAL